MEYIIWTQILLELALSLSGEQELDKLVKKASTAFLKKLNCTLVSVLQYKNNHMETIYVVPHSAIKDPEYYKLIRGFERKLLKGTDKNVIVTKKDLNYYGFPLKNFGLLLLGRSAPIEEPFLKELLPIINMLAQNCFANLDIAMKRQAIEAELEKERIEANKKLQTEKKWLEVLFKNSTDAIVCIDHNYRIEEINYSFYKLFGYRLNEIKGKDIDQVLYMETENTIDRHYTKALLSGKEIVAEGTHYTKEGLPVEVIIKGHPVIIDGKLLGAYVIYNDITERKKYEEQLKYLSSHDQLTGLYNRNFLEIEINRLDTPRQLPISVIIGDLNGLKLTNDVFGHQEGDKLLIKAVEIIKSSCRSEDLIARWGGDELVIFLPQADTETAEKITQRIKERCICREDGTIDISIALGYATKSRAEENIWQIFKEAESRMYSDKILHAKRYRDRVISSMKANLFEKSMGTEGHAERLKDICRKIGEHMDLNNQLLDELELLATMHDIGKVAINENILMKPGPLTKDEWIEMRKHPEIGYRIALTAPELSPIAEYILYHHERWDGKGYPQGLKGEEIPLLSRIIAVADVFDAMINDRPYRKAISKEEAIAEIKKNAGLQFDPEVVSAFIKSCS